MRILYIAPQYYANQIPVIKGWIREGSEVCFISQFSSNLENYEALQPHVWGALLCVARYEERKKPLAYGKNAYDDVQENYRFENYKESIEKILAEYSN